MSSALSPIIASLTRDVHATMQEAFDIFGDVGDLLEMYDARKRTDADDAEAEQEPDFSDEDAAETFRLEQVCQLLPMYSAPTCISGVPKPVDAIILLGAL